MEEDEADRFSELKDHLEMIQNVVERHARNSFLLKGWSVTLVAAVYVMASRSPEPSLVLPIAFLPALSFWGLDAYYLRQERLFRELFNHVRRNGCAPEDRFTMNVQPFSSSVSGWAAIARSRSIVCFHLAIVASVIAGAFLIACGGSRLGS